MMIYGIGVKGIVVLLKILLGIKSCGLTMADMVGTFILYQAKDEGNPFVRYDLSKAFPQNLKGVFDDILTHLLVAYHLTGVMTGMLIMRLEKLLKFCFFLQDVLFSTYSLQSYEK